MFVRTLHHRAAATDLGRQARVGSIAVGKQADLVVVNGNPSATIGDVRKIEAVFKTASSRRQQDPKVRRKIN